jgi:hypothetical protein
VILGDGASFVVHGAWYQDQECQIRKTGDHLARVGREDCRARPQRDHLNGSPSMVGMEMGDLVVTLVPIQRCHSAANFKNFDR